MTWLLAGADTGIIAESFADDVFFVLAAALSRSFATGSELVASATINHVTALLDDNVRLALLRAVQMCTGQAAVGLYRAPSVDKGEEAEDALGDALAEALLLSSGASPLPFVHFATCSPCKPHQRLTVCHRRGRQSSGPPSSKSVEAKDEDEDGEGAAVLTRKMVVAMNTVALSATHADSLGQR